MNIETTNSHSSRLTDGTTSSKLLVILKQELGVCIYSVFISYTVDNCTFLDKL